MRELSLFTGGGGGLLGTKLLGWESIGYVEWNEHCQKTIAQRIKDGFLPWAPIFCDIRSFIGEGYSESYSGMVDVITAGFPCQPFSLFGKGKAENDSRNMWPETISVIRTVKPKFCLLENVPGLLTHEYIRTIFRELAESGYNCRWRCLSAAELGANHKRDRLWIVAYSTRESITKAEFQEVERKLFQQCQPRGVFNENIPRYYWETDKPGVVEMDDGVADWVGPVSAYGNGQVPIVAATAWKLLTA